MLPICSAYHARILRIVSMRALDIKYAVIPTHSAEWRVAVRKFHEKNTIDGNEQDASPLRQFHHLVPVGPSIRQLCTSPVSSLELELVLLRQLAELWRPCALADVWVGFPGVWEVGRIDGWDFGCCEWVEAYPPSESGQHVDWYVGSRGQCSNWPEGEGCRRVSAPGCGIAILRLGHVHSA
jgi:hypothetical protein